MQAAPPASRRPQGLRRPSAPASPANKLGWKWPRPRIRGLRPLVQVSRPLRKLDRTRSLQAALPADGLGPSAASSSPTATADPGHIRPVLRNSESSRPPRAADPHRNRYTFTKQFQPTPAGHTHAFPYASNHRPTPRLLQRRRLVAELPRALRTSLSQGVARRIVSTAEPDEVRARDGRPALSRRPAEASCRPSSLAARCDRQVQ